MRWNRPGIPHKGWRLVDCVDIFEDAINDEDTEYETCEMCQNERIRYVHILKHPDYPETMRVGCVCAEKMTGDYETHKEDERRLRNRSARRRNFLKQEWHKNLKGNLVLRYKGKNVTAIERNGSYGFVYQNEWVWRYKGRRIQDLETLKLAAFELFDEE